MKESTLSLVQRPVLNWLKALTEQLGLTVGIEAGDNVANTGVSHVQLISAGVSHGIFAASVNYVS